ncbi:hypothetical protein K438DRAFT_1977582 [Mycena galopus ATCC 62051]|nr:hypothetical protein K438DRAFT_1977582 [Mycena galopus ATCC 62051]
MATPEKHFAADGAAALTTRRRPALRFAVASKEPALGLAVPTTTRKTKRTRRIIAPQLTIFTCMRPSCFSAPSSKPAFLVHVLLVRGRLAAVPSNLWPPWLRGGGVAALEIIATHSATHSGSASPLLARAVRLCATSPHLRSLLHLHTSAFGIGHGHGAGG